MEIESILHDTSNMLMLLLLESSVIQPSSFISRGAETSEKLVDSYVLIKTFCSYIIFT